MTNRFIAECEQEALHLSGAIQPHGALLIADSKGLVSHVSANIALFLGRAVDELLEQSLPAMLAKLVPILPGGRAQRQTILNAVETTDPLDVILTRDDNDNLLFELLRYSPLSDAGLDASLREIDPIYGRQSLAELFDGLAKQIAEVTDFDRVMLYRFASDGDGEVVAESRREGIYGSYLGLRFPASDIPLNARRLYLKNPWRMIPDAREQAIDIVSSRSQFADLSYADLRSVASVHCTYLANMDVRASLSFPIVIAGDLFGLVACHHRQPRSVSASVLLTASKLVKHYTMAISGLRAQQRLQLVDGLSRRFNEIRPLLSGPLDLPETWPTLASWLLQEFDCDGVTLCWKDGLLTAGTALEADAVSMLDAWFAGESSELVWQTDSLSRQLPGFPLSNSAGALALKLKIAPHSSLRLYLTRTEHIYEVAWGGNPEKPIEYLDGGLNIAPRRSFEKWLEKRMGYCRPWESQARLLLLKLREMLLVLQGE